MSEVREEGRKPDFLESLGVEVECGIDEAGYWALIDEWYPKPNFSYGIDWSVRVNTRDYSNREFRYWNEDVESVYGFLDSLWNVYGIEQNATCGNHVHLKIAPDFVNAFCYKPFREFLIKEYKRRYRRKKYRERLECKYCRRGWNYFVDKEEDEARYSAVNYLALEDHETIEVRIFPWASGYKEHKEMIEFLLGVTEKFLGEEVESVKIPLHRGIKQSWNIRREQCVRLFTVRREKLNR